MGKETDQESDGENLVQMDGQMHSILSLKKSRNVLTREDASGDNGETGVDIQLPSIFDHCMHVSFCACHLLV